MDLVTLLGNCQNPGEKRLSLLTLLLCRCLTLRKRGLAAARRGAGLSFRKWATAFCSPQKISLWQLVLYLSRE